MFKVLNRVIFTVITRFLIQIPLNLDKKINKRYYIQRGIELAKIM